MPSPSPRFHRSFSSKDVRHFRSNPILQMVLKMAAAILAVFLIGFLTACSSKTTSTTSPPAKTASTQSGGGGGADKVNLDDIFPPGRGRELVLNNCTTCHTFVPIVVLQLTKEAWERNSRIHRERVPSMSDADFRTLYDYLEASFNPDRPVPKLPKALLDTWTSY
jgi:hypothetical protein